MGAYQHWKNLGQGGDMVFVTTTDLDFASVFAGSDAKERMVRLLFLDHKLYGATLYVFVVMQNHVFMPQGRIAAGLALAADSGPEAFSARLQ